MPHAHVDAAAFELAQHLLCALGFRSVTLRGVDPARLDLRSERPAGQTHLGIYHEIDIALDAQPWSGHTTSCESTWMGVPFVTIRGRSHAGRMAASALTFAGGAEEFIAEDETQYVRIVTQLA